MEPRYQGSTEPPQDVSADIFRAKLTALGKSQYGLAKDMMALGDKRSFDTILRSIQRMAAGESRVSGEMQAILGFFTRDMERAKYDASNLHWVTDANGIVTSSTKGFSIKLIRERSGWKIEVVEECSQYCHPWPTFPDNLEDAKTKSMIWLDDARRYRKEMAELDQQIATRKAGVS